MGYICKIFLSLLLVLVQSPESCFQIIPVEDWLFIKHTYKATAILREKCPNTKLFLVRIFLYSVRIQGNTDQKKLRIWTLFTQC